jgi:DNA polymerase III delta subunit
VLVLDADQKLGNSTFSKEMKKHAQVFEFLTEEKYNVFDVTNAMERQPAVALKILNHVLEDGQHPLQVMGGLVWFWGKHKTRISKESYKKGLMYLQEADLNIKRSKIRSDYAVEMLVTKLSLLIA